MILLPITCFGLGVDVEELILMQKNITTDNKEEVMDFVAAGAQNSQRYKDEVQQIVRASHKNSSCNASKYPLFSEIMKGHDVENITSNEQELYIFVSLSMPKTSLLGYLQEAREVGGTLVLRGLKENSYRKTAQMLQAIIKQVGLGVIIEPSLFKKYDVTLVPTVVMAEQNRFDKIAGNISLKYALEQITNNGDLPTKVLNLLNKKT